MGLTRSQTWKKLIADCFPNCLSELRKIDEVNSKICLVDLPILMRKIVTSVTTWGDIFKNLNGYIRHKINSGYSEIHFFIDNVQFVPQNKSLTQQKRKEDREKRGIFPLTEKECELVIPELNDKIDKYINIQGKITPFDRIFITPKLLRRVYSWMVSEFISSLKLGGKWRKISFDSVSFEYISKEMSLIKSINIVNNDETEISKKIFWKNCLKFQCDRQVVEFPSVKVEINNCNINKVDISFFEPLPLGEAELLIMNEIVLKPKCATYVIDSSDTDFYPIILMNMRNILRRGNIECKIYVTSDFLKFIDFLSLWRSLYDDLGDLKNLHYKFPVEYFVLNMLISGNDYITPLPGILPDFIHKSLENNPNLFEDTSFFISCGQTTIINMDNSFGFIPEIQRKIIKIDEMLFEKYIHHLIKTRDYKNKGSEKYFEIRQPCNLLILRRNIEWYINYVFSGLQFRSITPDPYLRTPEGQRHWCFFKTSDERKLYVQNFKDNREDLISNDECSEFMDMEM